MVFLFNGQYDSGIQSSPKCIGVYGSFGISLTNWLSLGCSVEAAYSGKDAEWEISEDGLALNL